MIKKIAIALLLTFTISSAQAGYLVKTLSVAGAYAAFHMATSHHGAGSKLVYNKAKDKLTAYAQAHPEKVEALATKAAAYIKKHPESAKKGVELLLSSGVITSEKAKSLLSSVS